MAAGSALSTGVDVLLLGEAQTNLRRANTSSEETAVDPQEDATLTTDYEKTNGVDVRIEASLTSGYRIINLDAPDGRLISENEPKFDFYQPSVFFAQLIDTMTFLVMLAYFGKMISLILSAASTGQPWIWPALFVTAKVFNYSSQILDHLWRFSSFVVKKRNTSPRFRILDVKGQLLPRVDIIITTYNEQVQNVLDTIEAAAAIDYPRDRFRVFVADDGKDSELEISVQEISKKYANVIYFARDKQNRPLRQESHGSKAGNVNDCIDHATKLGKDSTEWYLCLDADMIPSRDILRALVAHTVGDVRVGMVTLPQSFYNLPINDPLHQDMCPHSDGDEVMRDRLEAAWCPGSGFLVSAESLQAVGGFPETSIAEDVLFSWILQGRGYKTVYVNEKLQWGLQPNSLASHIGQRTKWCVGHINNSLELKFCILQPRTAGMGWIQWVAAFLYCLKPWTTLLKFLSWCMLACALGSGKPFIAALTQQALMSTLYYHLSFWVMTRINEKVVSRNFGYWALRRQSEFNIWMAPALTWAIVLELWPNKWGGHNLGFTATGSMRAAVDERNGATRGTWYRRVFAMNRDTFFWMHVNFFIAMVYFICRNLCAAHDPMAVLTTALFPGLGFEQLPAFLNLLLYALNPPTDAPRRSLMIQNEHGIWGPSPNARGVHWDRWVWLLELPQCIATIWAVVSIFLFWLKFG